MAQDQNFDIVIVGGGIVGLSCAGNLRHANLTLALIDDQPKPPAFPQKNLQNIVFSPRVSALTLPSRKLMEKLGVWERIESSGACHYEEMEVWDADGTGSIHFSAADIHQPMLGHIVENSAITSALSESLGSQENLRLLQPDKMVDFEKLDLTGSSNPEQGKFRIRLDSGISITGKLLVGADGGNSLLREQAKFTVKQWDYGHRAIVTTVKTEYSHGFTARQVFMPAGPLAFLPLKNPASEKSSAQHYCSIVWSCLPERAEELMALGDKTFAVALEKAFESSLGKIEKVDKRFVFPLWQKYASDYVQEGIALVGDAAHTIHPLAGQGVNLGLLDIAVLSEVIESASAKDEDFSSIQVLSRYQRKRKGNNLGMMLLMEGFKRLFESDDLALRWLRNRGMSSIDSLPLIKNQLMSKAMGL